MGRMAGGECYRQEPLRNRFTGAAAASSHKQRQHAAHNKAFSPIKATNAGKLLRIDGSIKQAVQMYKSPTERARATGMP